MMGDAGSDRVLFSVDLVFRMKLNCKNLKSNKNVKAVCKFCISYNCGVNTRIAWNGMCTQV